MGYGLSTRTQLLRAVLHEDNVDLAHAIDYVADEAGVPPGQSYDSAQVRASLLELLRDLHAEEFIEVGDWESDGAFQPWVVSTEDVLTHRPTVVAGRSLLCPRHLDRPHTPRRSVGELGRWRRTLGVT